MKTINRYILGELLKTFIFSLILMTSLLIIVGLLQQMLMKSVPLEKIVFLIPYVTVEMSRISLPMTLLLAVTTFFARMSGSNEIVALKSLGIPPWKILWPVMFLGFLVSLLSVWLNDLAVTWGRPGVAMIIFHASEDIVLNELKKNRTFSTRDGKLTIMVNSVENRRLISPTITLKDPPTTINARFAQLKIDFVASEFSIELTGMKAEGNKGSIVSEYRLFQIPLDNVLNTADIARGPSETGMHEIPFLLAKEREKIECLERRTATRKAFAAVLGNLSEWGGAEVERINTDTTSTEHLITRYQVESPRRWSAGFSCFFFIWLGAPLAIWMKKSDIFASFFACFVPILLFYYPLFILGLQEAKGGDLPPSAVWLGNIALGIAGIWFLRRIHRY